MRAPLLAALLSATPALAAAPDRTDAAAFEAANQLYEQSRLEEAIRAYRALLAAHPRSPDLHYNLGNAYFRFGQPGSLGLAIASFERAFALRPRDGDLRHNLDFALRRAGESLVPPGVPSALFATFYLFSRDELAALHAAALWAACLLSLAYLLKPPLRSRLRAPCAAAAAVWLAAAGWWGTRALVVPASPGVILIQQAEVRSGPGDSFPVSFRAPEGRRVTVLAVKGKWAEIGVLKEGLKGWLPADQVERI